MLTMPRERGGPALPEGFAADGDTGPLTTEEVARARRDIKEYLARRAHEIREGGVEDLLEPRLEGVHGEYLQALRANVVAEQRCAEALQRVQQLNLDAKTVNASSDTNSATLLQSHLNLARLQKQHGGLVDLKDEFEALKLSRGFSSLRIGVDVDVPVTVTEPMDNGGGGAELTKLADLVQKQVKALEIAVIQGQHEATRQAGILENLKAQARPPSTFTTQQRVHALSSTRSELTTWLEESLEKCQDDTDGSRGLEQANGQGVGFDDVEMERKTDEGYERYLEARKRLLSAVSVLKTELSVESSEIEGHESKNEEKDTPKQRKLDFSHTLGFIEKSLLPAMQQNNITQHHSALAEEQLVNETSSIVRVIDRLSDESQLLQAFPMLAHSGRFQHASSVFGKKSTEQSVAQDEITQRIKPWLFAAEAADVVAASGIEKQVKQGKEAIESVSRSLAELRLLMEANDSSTFER
jgi:hypothetical protein